MFNNALNCIRIFSFSHEYGLYKITPRYKKIGEHALLLRYNHEDKGPNPAQVNRGKRIFITKTVAFSCMLDHNQSVIQKIYEDKESYENFSITPSALSHLTYIENDAKNERIIQWESHSHDMKHKVPYNLMKSLRIYAGSYKIITNHNWGYYTKPDKASPHTFSIISKMHSNWSTSYNIDTFVPDTD